MLFSLSLFFISHSTEHLQKENNYPLSSWRTACCHPGCFWFCSLCYLCPVTDLLTSALFLWSFFSGLWPQDNPGKKGRWSVINSDDWKTTICAKVGVKAKNNLKVKIEDCREECVRKLSKWRASAEVAARESGDLSGPWGSTCKAIEGGGECTGQHGWRRLSRLLYWVESSSHDASNMTVGAEGVGTEPSPKTKNCEVRVMLCSVWGERSTLGGGKEENLSYPEEK